MIRIVLVEPSHGGNIGAVARAMKNMGLQQLALVNPRHFLSAECIARASGADDVLQAAQVYSSLDEAIADCHWVLGSSARQRHIALPQYEPRAAAAQIRQRADQKIAILFGRESSGLSNEELDRCHALVHIPAHPDYSSLNLAMAVQIIAYEIYLSQGQPAQTRERQPASADELNGFFAHLQQMLDDIGFNDQRQSQKLMRRLRRLFFRAEMDSDEIKIMRGIFSAAQGRKSARRQRRQ